MRRRFVPAIAAVLIAGSCSPSPEPTALPTSETTEPSTAEPDPGGIPDAGLPVAVALDLHVVQQVAVAIRQPGNPQHEPGDRTAAVGLGQGLIDQDEATVSVFGENEIRIEVNDLPQEIALVGDFGMRRAQSLLVQHLLGDIAV